MPPASPPAVVAGYQSVRHLALALVAAAVVGLGSAHSAAAQTHSDVALYDGFMKTVFGAEYHSGAGAANQVKKFTRPVRVYIDNQSRIDRRPAAAKFVDSLRTRIAGLDIRRTSDQRRANLVIHIVDVAQYHAFARSLMGSSHAGGYGQCMVRIATGYNAAISRSDAIIVSDGGEGLFRRCLIEETLQALGPVNDSPDLPASVFNDRSQHERLTEFDRTIVNMLYDRRIRPGMSRRAVLPLLPQVLADVRRRMQ